jgi:anti-anti-sigma factor
MDIKHSKESEFSIITINGRLDAATAPVANKTIKNILEGDCLRMLFDFSKLDYLGSGGLRVILGAIKELRRQGGQIVLCCLPNLVKEIFLVSGFTSVVPIAESVESGIEQLGVKPVQTSTNSGVEGLGLRPSGLGLRPSGLGLRLTASTPQADPTRRVQGSAQPLAA